MGPSLRVLQTIRQTGKDGPVWDRPLRKERNRFDICRRGGAEGELPRRGKRSHPGVCPSRRISEISPCLAGHSGPGPCDKGRMTSGYTVGAAISRPKAFPLQGGRCPRRGRMRVGSGMAGTPQRAGQCPAPTKYGDGLQIHRRGDPCGRPLLRNLFHP